MAKSKLGKLVALSAVVGAGAWVYKKYDTIKSMYHKVSIFKGERYEFDEFDGEAIAAMFSGVLIDLSNVEFVEEEVYLDIYSLCSGIRILIPKDVEVVLEGTNHASGVQVDQNEDVPKTKTLYINYNITASGLQVTDNIDECCNDKDSCCDDDEPCCDDPDCNDPNCCEPEVDEEDTSTEEEPFVPEESFEEFNEDSFETMSEEADETIGEIEENIEELDESIGEIEENIEEVVNQAAEELNEAATQVDEAIDEFVIKKEDEFEYFGEDDSKDDFFE